MHLHNLADIEHTAGRADHAEHLYRQSLDLKEELLGPAHPEVGLVTNNLGTLLHQQRRHSEAADCYRRALAIAERTYPPDHPTTAAIQHHIHELSPAALMYASGSPRSWTKDQRGNHWTINPRTDLPPAS